MDIILIPLIQTIDVLINLYIWAILLYIIIGWLEYFGVLNPYNRLVFAVQNTLFRAIEPALGPIRNFLPQLGALDISPVILILLLGFLQGVLHRIISHLI